MRKHAGFTTIELLIAVLFLVVAGTLFMFEKRDVDSINRDTQRKTAINAMYYNLEEVYFPANKSYPRVVNSTVLKAMDPALFKDPAGKAIDASGSDYRYEPTGCDGDKCTGYSLRAHMEKEADFVKENR